MKASKKISDFEFGDTQQIFESPVAEKTKAYVSGQFD